MPGVPGAGLSGLFYVISAFLALLVELAATVRGRSSVARWLVVIKVSSLAAGIVLSINLAYTVVKLIFPDAQPQPELVAGGEPVAAVTTSEPFDAASLELLPVAPVLMTVGTLAFLLAVTLLFGLALGCRDARDGQSVAGTSPPEADSSAEGSRIAA